MVDSGWDVGLGVREGARGGQNVPGSPPSLSSHHYCSHPSLKEEKSTSERHSLSQFPVNSFLTKSEKRTDNSLSDREKYLPLDTADC